MSAAFDKISIVGLGLVGASVALGLKKRGFVDRISAYDTDAESLEFGLSRSIIDEKATSIANCAEGSGLLVLAVPVRSIAASLAQLKDVTAIITDVSSVKSPVLKAGEEIFGESPANLVPGHPIAGSEQHGVEAADPNLFENHKVILTPAASTDEGAINSVEEMWQCLGARVIRMSAGHHDSVFAQTSHLPHLLAYALVDTLSVQGDSLEIFEYAAGGFRDFSRIAASDPVMWRDIFDANGEEVLDIMDKYMDELTEIRTLIAEGRMGELEALFKRAKVARDHFSSINAQPRKASD